MAQKKLASHLRSHRKKTGLSQLELAKLIGYLSEDGVMHHEQATSIPSLLVAFAYEAVFRVPASKLFPGIYETVERRIDERLAALECSLQEQNAKDRKATATARKLEWLWARKNGVEV